MSRSMIVLAEYQVKDILPLLKSNKEKIELTLNNGTKFNVRINSSRLLCFRYSQSCVWCGKVGNRFRLEHTSAQKENPHLNLYHTSTGYEPLLMTQDHVIPRSRGGKNNIDNLCTMCSTCNVKKGSLLPLNFVMRMTGWENFFIRDQEQYASYHSHSSP